MKLVIVESPAKAKTIEKFLGSGYKVESSYGHIRDLPGSAAEIPEEVKDQAWSRLGVDPNNNFTPVYIIPKDSRKRIKELKKLVKDAEEILLATDEDREGEAISWHLKEVLEPKVPVKRITFNEITKSAIQEALAKPRDIDSQLVRAQESRRILDRLYGYTLSPVLWKKVRTNLSAGRVQSVAVRLIVEREEERRSFVVSEYWDVQANFKGSDKEFSATLHQIDHQRLATGKDFDPTTGKLKEHSKAVVVDKQLAEELAQKSLETLPWHVERVERTEAHKRPAPPFTTSTLQQAASSQLNMTPRQTMMVAQRLYEGIDLGGGDREGLITYMRTDSLTLSQKALHDAQNYITHTFGNEYHSGPRIYKTKSKLAQEAHEAIRPTEIMRDPNSIKPFLSKEEFDLYNLIWRRTVASQMTDALLDKTSVDISVDFDEKHLIFRATGSVVHFPGFLKVYGDAQQDTLLPPLTEGQEIVGRDQPGEVTLLSTQPQGHTTNPPARYTEASLVKKLEEQGIGRPLDLRPDHFHDPGAELCHQEE